MTESKPLNLLVEYFKKSRGSKSLKVIVNNLFKENFYGKRN